MEGLIVSRKGKGRLLFKYCRLLRQEIGARGEKWHSRGASVFPNYRQASLSVTCLVERPALNLRDDLKRMFDGGRAGEF